jgi:hypothetical protein
LEVGLPFFEECGAALFVVPRAKKIVKERSLQPDAFVKRHAVTTEHRLFGGADS